MALTLKSAVTLMLLIVLIFCLMRRFLHGIVPQGAKTPSHEDILDNLPQPSPLSRRLASALPGSVILPRDQDAFKQSMNSYWAKQEREVIPDCVVRPQDVKQLSTVMKIPKHEYDQGQSGAEKRKSLFAIRSGGHSPVSNAASVHGGIMIDMSLLDDVIPSEDGSSVSIGSGAKWAKVFDMLDQKGLAMVGGRNAEFQSSKVLTIFHDDISQSTNGRYDEYAAGPIVCFSYIQQANLQVVSVNLAYTDPPAKSDKWPAYWKSSRWASLWRLWSTFKRHSNASANVEMASLNPPGRRQCFVATTIRNDQITLTAAHAAYTAAIVPLRRAAPKGLVWTLILQPILPEWVGKGDPNPLGLDDAADPLILVSFTVNWNEARDDTFVQSTIRETVEKIENAAASRNCGHRYRFLNYCAKWQRPFEGYGPENLQFLQQMSKSTTKMDCFQRACTGGFKLGMYEEPGSLQEDSC